MMDGAYNYIRNNVLKANMADYVTGRYKYVRVFGENAEIDVATAPEDIWQFGGVMTYDNTPQPYYFTSSDDGDNMPIRFSVLEADENGNWDEAVYVKECLGNQPTLISINCVRFLSAENVGVTSDDVAGTVYVFADTTVTYGIPDDVTEVKGIIYDGNNCSMQTHYTIPTGYVGFLLKIAAGSSKYLSQTGARISIRTRRFGGVFCNRGIVALSTAGTTYAADERVIPDPMPAKTDFKMVCDEVSANDFAIFGKYEMVLVPENELSNEFLDSIGQIRRV